MGSMNRSQRRKAEREQVKEWRRQGKYEQVLSLQKNGITQRDLDDAQRKGYEDGYLYASEKFMRKMYAAIAKELLDAGNGRDDIVAFVKGVDHRFSVMFDAEEEIDDVYNKIGVWFNIDRNAITHIEEDE